MENNIQTLVHDYRTDTAIIEAEKNHEYQALLQSLTRKVTKISRKEAKSKYLYRRLDGHPRLI